MGSRDGHQICYAFSFSSQIPSQLGWEHVMGSGQWTAGRISGCHFQADVVESGCTSFLALFPAAKRPWVQAGIASQGTKGARPSWPLSDFAQERNKPLLNHWYLEIDLLPQNHIAKYTNALIHCNRTLGLIGMSQVTWLSRPWFSHL